MERTYNLILADDHRIFRDALKFVLAQSNLLNVVGEATNGNELLEILDTCTPDLILMDISMPGLDGIDTTREAIKRYPGLKIIALSMYSDEMYYYKMLEAGAQGFLLKESGSEELFKAIFMVLDGENYFSNQILCKIIRDFLEERDAREITFKKEVKLSKRENEILKLICKGFSNNEIASTLGISRRTIEGHRSSLLDKTGVKNSVHLALYAKRNQILFD
jgi:DNA-binding NarL/FixJ family response regulator